MKVKSTALHHYDDVIASASMDLQLIERYVNQPFPQNSFMQYIKTINHYEKLMLALTLKLPFTKKDLKQWPDLLFYKKLNLTLKKINTDKKIRQLLLIFLIDRSIKEAPPLETIRTQLPDLFSEHGYWKLYWTLYFHNERCDNEDTYQQLINELQIQQSDTENQHSPPQANLEVAATSAQTLARDKEYTSNATDKQEQIKIDKKISILEEKISKEIATRQQLELAGVQKDKMYRQLQQEQEKLQQQTNLLKEQITMYEMKLVTLEGKQQEFTQRRKEEEERWLSERNHLLGQNKTSLDEIRKLNQQLELAYKELEDSRRQTSNWQQLAQQRQEEIHVLSTVKQPLDKQLQSVSEEMHYHLEGYNKELLELMHVANATYEDRSYYRQQMLNILQLVESIDKFQHDRLLLQQKRNPAYEEAPIAVEQLFTKEELERVVPNIQVATGKQRYGTFYRRDHGGYIELENGEQFNITESLVQQLELQHEAEVLCTPTAHPGRNNHFTIELLFQGDDSYSPVQTYDGFVQLEEEKWYCVDINDEDNRYPIHFKDVEIQKPANGDPCIFNVAEDGHIARLTKLYRVQGAEPLDVHPARKKNEQRQRANTRIKVEPFLEDCMITIIGGQRKWFESVVKETGATLVHDGGEHPERISSELSRSQALFMILTSTSHRATWEGIEIAKSNQIPHYIIQGSKSNLRKLLYDNREIIRTSNRGVDA